MKRRRGFTLTEFLVVVSVLLILAALLFPAIRAAKQAATQQQMSKTVQAPGSLLHHYSVITIEDCEYIILDEGGHGQSFAHKGNCKFCYQRNR